MSNGIFVEKGGGVRKVYDAAEIKSMGPKELIQKRQLDFQTIMNAALGHGDVNRDQVIIAGIRLNRINAVLDQSNPTLTTDDE